MEPVFGKDHDIAAHKAGWRRGKHAAQWANTLKTHGSPLTMLPVQAVDTALVVKVLEPLWATRAETDSRLREHIESVLDFAKVRELRDGENPARWRDHLAELLPAHSKVRKVKLSSAAQFPTSGFAPPTFADC